LIANYNVNNVLMNTILLMDQPVIKEVSHFVVFTDQINLNVSNVQINIISIQMDYVNLIRKFSIVSSTILSSQTHVSNVIIYHFYLMFKIYVQPLQLLIVQFIYLLHNVLNVMMVTN